MNINEREALKARLEADLRLLIAESWHIDVIDRLQDVLNNLQQVRLEGYDD